MVAINSHVALPIARQCAERQPDLLVVHLGNNEVVGPFGAAGVLGGLLALSNKAQAGKHDLYECFYQVKCAYPFCPPSVQSCGGCPSYFSSIGFGSKLSTCEHPPFMNRKITRFTRCG